MTAWLAAALVAVVVFATRRAIDVTRRRTAVSRLGDARRTAKRVDRLPAPPAWLEAALADAVVPYDSRVVAWTWAAALVLAPMAAAATAGPGLALAAAAAVATVPSLALRLSRGRRVAAIEAALPLALEAMARSLRTGGSLRQAVSEAASAATPPLADDLGVVAGAVAHGAPLATALEQWAEARPLPGVRLAAAALTLGAETGGGQAKAIDGVARTIRDRLGAVAEVKAQATQARVSAAVIALSPLAFGVLSTATDHRTATFLLRTAPGLVLLTTGLALDALGAAWMARLTRVEP